MASGKITAVGLARKGGQMHEAEVVALKKLVRLIQSPKPVFLNIGAGLEGISTLAMLEERPDAVIFSIDVEPCPGEAESLRKAGMDPRRVIRLLGRSQDIGQYWCWPVDFAFIDGEHLYSAVMSDIELFVPWVMEIIAFHDYIPCPSAKKMRRAKFAIDEGMAGYEKILHVDRLIAFWQKIV